MPLKLSDIPSNNSSEKKNSLLQQEISLGPAFSSQQKALLYGEIALMLESGLTIKEALNLLADEQKSGKRKEILSGISTSISAGQQLQEAFSQCGAFSHYECITIKTGEESGNLSQVIKKLSEHFHNRVAQQRTLWGALTYPLVILLTSIGAVAFMMLYMVPMFKDVFARTGKELPLITQWVINLSEFLSNTWHYGFFITAALAIFLVYSRKNKNLRQVRSKFLLSLPIIGKHYRTSIIMQWSSAMALMLDSGVLLINALKLSRALTSDFSLEQSLERIENSLLRGNSLNYALQQEKLFDSRLCLMVKVAEETHALGNMFNQIATQYKNQMEHRSKMLGTLLEPLIILFLGGIVGFILLAMYLPIFQMGSGV